MHLVLFRDGKGVEHRAVRDDLGMNHIDVRQFLSRFRNEDRFCPSRMLSLKRRQTNGA